MISFAGIVLIIIFILIAAIHFYWAFGGKWGGSAALPTMEDNKLVMQPGILPTLIVAFGLLTFGLFVLLHLTTIKLPILHGIAYKYGLWVIAFIFGVRAIGDFRYVGFFKKIKKTKFAIYDTKYFTPLCVLISAFSFLIIINK